MGMLGGAAAGSVAFCSSSKSEDITARANDAADQEPGSEPLSARCKSGAAEVKIRPGVQNSWWAKLTGNVSTPNKQKDEPPLPIDNPSKEADQESEGWWSWAAEKLARKPLPSPPVEVPLPLDKLCCKRHRDGLTGERPPVVLLSCGSFNPPTVAHLRMFELAHDALVEQGYDVLGGYMSPVNDAYGKKDLVAAKHRVNMARLAAESSDLIMVDSWEASQPAWQRTLMVMTRIHDSLLEMLTPSQPQQPRQSSRAFSATGGAEGKEAELDAMTADATDFPGSHSARTPSGDAASPSGIAKARLSKEDEEPTVGRFTGHSAHAAWASPHAAPQKPLPLSAASEGANKASVQAPQGRVSATAAVDSPLAKAETASAAGRIAPGTNSADINLPAEHIPDSTLASIQAPRVMLLCGADLVESFATPGLWRTDHLRAIVSEQHGVVCIARHGSDVKRMLANSSGSRVDLASGITVIEDPISSDISSSRVRTLLQQDKSVKYLVPDAVVEYIKLHHLYTESSGEAKA